MTKVILRKFPEGDTIALFPDEVADHHGNIMSYQRIGQHGAASPDLVYELEPCTKSEASKLLKELESIGYDDLEVLNDQC